MKLFCNVLLVETQLWTVSLDSQLSCRNSHVRKTQLCSKHSSARTAFLQQAAQAHKKKKKNKDDSADDEHIESDPLSLKHRVEDMEKNDPETFLLHLKEYVSEFFDCIVVLIDNFWRLNIKKYNDCMFQCLQVCKVPTTWTSGYGQKAVWLLKDYEIKRIWSQALQYCCFWVWVGYLQSVALSLKLALAGSHGLSPLAYLSVALNIWIGLRRTVRRICAWMRTQQMRSGSATLQTQTFTEIKSSQMTRKAVQLDWYLECSTVCIYATSQPSMSFLQATSERP